MLGAGEDAPRGKVERLRQDAHTDMRRDASLLRGAQSYWGQ
jgi:hypothetical protein